MFGWGGATRIYLAAGATDMRKGFEGLYGMARDRLLCDPLSGHVFLLANAQRNRLKLLPIIFRVCVESFRLSTVILQLWSGQ